MIIKSIELKNFRNYDDLCIEFDRETNIPFGDNAQGKTNILESAAVSATTKSHKGSRDKVPASIFHTFHKIPQVSRRQVSQRKAIHK